MVRNVGLRLTHSQGSVADDSYPTIHPVETWIPYRISRPPSEKDGPGSGLSRPGAGPEERGCF